MCSPRVCFIVWTTVILGLATALLVNVIVVNTAPGKDFTHWLPLTLLIVICVVVSIGYSTRIVPIISGRSQSGRPHGCHWKDSRPAVFESLLSRDHSLLPHLQLHHLDGV